MRNGPFPGARSIVSPQSGRSIVDRFPELDVIVELNEEESVSVRVVWVKEIDRAVQPCRFIGRVETEEDGAIRSTVPLEV